MKLSVFRAVMTASAMVFILSCAHKKVLIRPDASEAELREALNQICSIGDLTKTAKGTAWIQARSSESKGRFPSHVLAEARPSGDRLALEINNPFGGVEGKIRVEKGGSAEMTCEVQIPGKPPRSEGVNGTWSGIPLRWAPALFLGRIPCPQMAKGHRILIRADESGELWVTDDTSGEVFRYRLEAVEGRAWPETLVWETRGQRALRVEFKFEAPDAGTRSPSRFSVRAFQIGKSESEISVRWQQRETSRN